MESGVDDLATAGEDQVQRQRLVMSARLLSASTSSATCLVTLALVLLGITTPLASQEPETSPDKRLQNSALSFREIMREPDKGIPRELFDKARCIVIIPGMKKGAFVVGGKYGRGFVSCRAGEKGSFGSPAAVRIEGGSYERGWDEAPCGR
jgi:hypothetical protein